MTVSNKDYSDVQHKYELYVPPDALFCQGRSYYAWRHRNCESKGKNNNNNNNIFLHFTTTIKIIC